MILSVMYCLVRSLSILSVMYRREGAVKLVSS